MARYYPGPTPTGELEQTQRWLRDECDQIYGSTEDIYTLGEIVKELYVVAGYGGIGLDAITPLTDINATWQTLPFDVELIQVPRGITYALGSNALSFDQQAVWRINAKVSLEFVEAQNGRRMEMRLFNVSTGIAPSTVFNFSIGRNTDGANLTFNVLVPLQEETVGDIYVLQVRSAADVFTGVTAIGSVWDANNVSEYRGDLFDDAGKIVGRT